MTKNAGMEQYYEKMGGMSSFSNVPIPRTGERCSGLIVAMSPDEAAPILADFAGKLTMEMSGKFWAPSTYFPPSPWSLLILFTSFNYEIKVIRREDMLIIDGARGIGNAEEVMGKEWASQPGPLELPW